VTAPLRPGAIRIGVALGRDGQVADVRLRNSRPVGVARLFAGRPGAEIPALAMSLFSLCGFSHGVAARRAIAAARGTPVAGDASEARGLAAERLAETLRATLLGWPGAVGDGRIGAPLRETVAAARVLMAGVAGEEARGAATRIGAAVAALGLRPERPEAPAPGSVLADLLAAAQTEDFLQPQPLDALTPADDAAVLRALGAGREAFAAAPALPGRVVETGAFARHGGVSGGPTLAARLVARFLDMNEALAALRGDSAADAGAAQPTGPGEAFAALETARGRLYHWARIDAEGRVGAYLILAPTEWNFHPLGPFRAALLGAKPGAGAEASRRIGMAAALFDPCVAFEVELLADA
jgi:uptake hydrogenase large subunit